jgi:hypothetical protein
MRLGASLFLIAAGAILTYAVMDGAGGDDLRIVGIVALGIGGIGLIAELVSGHLLGELTGLSGTILPGRCEGRGTDAAIFAPSRRLLAQYLVRCPLCDKPAAAHLDESNPKTPVLVRLVCPDACRVDEHSVLGRLPLASHEATECAVAATGLSMGQRSPLRSR